MAVLHSTKISTTSKKFVKIDHLILFHKKVDPLHLFCGASQELLHQFLKLIELGLFTHHTTGKWEKNGSILFPSRSTLIFIFPAASHQIFFLTNQRGARCPPELEFNRKLPKQPSFTSGHLYFGASAGLQG